MAERKRCIVCKYTILSIYNTSNICGPCQKASKSNNSKNRKKMEDVYIKIEVDVKKNFPEFPEYNQEHIVRYILHYLGVPYRCIARIVSRDHKLIMRSCKKIHKGLKRDKEMENKIKKIIESNKNVAKIKVAVEGYH